MTARRPSPRPLSLTGKPLQRVVRVCCARRALEDFVRIEDIVVVMQSPAVETATACAARLADVPRAAGLGGERGRAVLSTEGAR